MEDVVPVIAMSLLFGGPLLVWIITTILGSIERMARDHQDAVLRMKMVDRGYSASEIERVSKLPRGQQEVEIEAEWQPVAPAKPAKV